MPADPRIAPAFAAAADYDRHARVQRHVATALACRIAAMPLPPAPRLLEIGCGTGFLTEALLECGLGGQWLVTDLAPAMVRRCRAKLGDHPGLTFRALDGEHGARPAEAPFDLICASLAFQWFADLPGAVARLLGWLAPGGQLVFTTLADGTFAEWRAAHVAEGLAAGTQPFPPAANLAALRLADQATTPTVETLTEPHPDARSFLAALKAIGAGTPGPLHRPLSTGQLRRVMARFEAAGATATYQIVTCHYRRTP